MSLVLECIFVEQFVRCVLIILSDNGKTVEVIRYVDVYVVTYGVIVRH